MFQVSMSKQFLIIGVYALPPSPAPAHFLRLVSHRPKFLGLVQTDKRVEEDKAASKGPQAQDPTGPTPNSWGVWLPPVSGPQLPEWSLLVWELVRMKEVH